MQLRTLLQMVESVKCHCLIVLYIERLEDIGHKMLGDLIQLSSLKFNTIVALLID
jgi:hypothetical protein